MKFFQLKAIGGVAYNQVADGSIRCYVDRRAAPLLNRALLELAQEVAQYQVEIVESQKAEERKKLELPPTRIQLLERELEEARLTAAATAALAAAPPLPINIGAAVDIPLHARAPVPGGYCPPAAPDFDEDQARKNTIVSGGREPDDGALPPPA